MGDELTIDDLNSLPESEARAEFERCCGSSRWTARMCESLPFRDAEAVFAAARGVFRELDREDWLEAFAHHPRIGDVASLREKFAATAAWAQDEQRGAAAAPEPALAALAEENRAYAEKFGYIFIVCATGKSVDQMLGLLRARIVNDEERELAIAAEEQVKITRIRLEKLLEARA
jgi:2-oxo-4-hydroxy-4-carboxy-5-ureidoimidazoline decarboxylase